MTSRTRSFTTLAALAVLAYGAVTPARALTLADVRGQASVGYAKLFTSDAPGGSLSTAAGVSIPVHGDWGLGLGIAFNLLGSRTVPRGSLIASVDYSMFEAGLFAHWSPPRLGPVGLISFGPEVVNARAELSTSGGGAGFRDLAVEEVAPGAALDVTLITRKVTPVRVGLELSGRHAFMTGDDWSLASARLVFHY